MDADLAWSLVGEQTMNLCPPTPEHLHALEEGVVLSLRPPFAFLLGFLRLGCCRANVATAVIAVAAGVFSVGHALLEARLCTGNLGARTGQDAAVAAGCGGCGGAAAADLCAGGRKKGTGRRGGRRAREDRCRWGGLACVLVLLVLHYLVVFPILPLFLAYAALALTRRQHHGPLFLLHILVLLSCLSLR